MRAVMTDVFESSYDFVISRCVSGSVVETAEAPPTEAAVVLKQGL